jgi:hypothetical protein
LTLRGEICIQSLVVLLLFDVGNLYQVICVSFGGPTVGKIELWEIFSVRNLWKFFNVGNLWRYFFILDIFENFCLFLV